MQRIARACRRFIDANFADAMFPQACRPIRARRTLPGATGFIDGARKLQQFVQPGAGHECKGADAGAAECIGQRFQLAAPVGDGVRRPGVLAHQRQSIALHREADHRRAAQEVIEGLPGGFETFDQARMVLMVELHGPQQDMQRAQKLRRQSFGIPGVGRRRDRRRAGTARRALRNGVRRTAARKLCQVLGGHGYFEAPQASAPLLPHTPALRHNWFHGSGQELTIRLRLRAALYKQGRRSRCVCVNHSFAVLGGTQIG